MADGPPTPEIISRKEAKALGLKRYFTGKPCKRGHVAERNVIRGHCLQCIQEYLNTDEYKAQRSKQRASPEGKAVSNAYYTRPEIIEHNKAYNRDRYANDPAIREARRIANAKYQATEKGKEVGRAAVARRRAQKLQNGGDLSADDLRYLRKTQKKCYLCGKRFTKNNPSTIEHIIPLSKGGSNDITNVVLAHLSCNRKKSAKIIQLL